MPLPTRWLIDVLSETGPLPPLAVAKALWQRHESEILATGDLLYTWQLDLQATADDLLARGALHVGSDGTWALPSAAQTLRRGWSEEEIAVAVTTYVSLLRAEDSGRAVGRSAALAQVTAATTRTEPQVETMMSNISAVVQEHGIEPLAAFRPRSNVPAGVRPLVAAALGA